MSGDGIFPKYRIERVDGHPIDDDYFVVREGDPHLAAVLAAFPGARFTTAGLRVFRTRDGSAVDAAAVLPFGRNNGVLWPMYSPAWPVRLALLAYARSCAAENPALADDLRSACSSHLPADDTAAALADAKERGMPECSSCGCVCDPEGAGGVCACDAACAFCSTDDAGRRVMMTKEGGR